jgi:hypothetical protein
MPPKEKNPCLGCGKECTGQQFSVLCTLCALWCHKECAGISDPFFKNLELQKKEMGTAFWACRSCVNFASTFGAKVNARLQEISDKVDTLEARMEENAGGLEKVQEKADAVEKKVEEVETVVENMEKQVNDGMYDEMRAREAIKRNIVMYGVKDPDRNITDGKERMEEDKAECERIFIAAGMTARKTDIRFCRRLGERGEEWRPILLGMKSETIKCEVLDQAKGLQNTIYKDVGIGPDQTKQQKQAEIRLKEEADRMNREELNDQDKAKNLKWAVIGPRGEKRIVKIQDREDREGSRGPPTRGGRGRGRGRGTWNNDRTGDRSRRGRQEEDMDTEMERPRSRTKQ